MCLLVLAWKAHPRFSLVIAANRDEYHDRPSEPLSKWGPQENILAGRDAQAGGTWLGIDRNRRFGVITNYRDAQPVKPAAPSRGELIPDYLNGSLDPEHFLRSLTPMAARYAGFNLLLADQSTLWYGANRADVFARQLDPGVHGLSNHLLDTPWPKLRQVRRRFEECLRASDGPDIMSLLTILNDRNSLPADTASDPQHLSAELKRALSAPFVLNPTYGTRCSTVLLLEPSGAVKVIERSFDRNGEPAGDREIDFRAHEW